MSLSRIYIWLLCFISLQTVSGIYVNLTRVRTGDYFSNPYDDNEFCLSTDSKCYEDFPESGDECRYCICSEGKTTFGLASLRCIPNEESLNKGECSLRFKGDLEQTILDFDLTKSGLKKIRNLKVPRRWKRRLQKCVVNKVEQMRSNGYKIVSRHTFKIGKIYSASDTFDLNWSEPNEGDGISGRVFKITFRCEYAKNGPRNGLTFGCIMLKSNGSVQIDHPGLPEATSSSVSEITAKTTTLPPSSSPSSSPSPSSSSPSSSPSPSSSLLFQLQSSLSPSKSTKRLAKKISPKLRPGRPTDPVSTRREAFMTTQAKESKTTRKATESINKTVKPSGTGPTFAARNEDEDDEDESNNAVTVSLAVVGCLLFLVVVVLVVLLFRRRSERTSKDRTTEISLTPGNVESPMYMVQPESIYAEADSSANYPENGDVSHEYDYVNGEYASLDTTKVGSQPTYQSLIGVERDLYEHIPSEGGKPSTEPFYHVVEGQTQDSSQVYHVLEEPEKKDTCETGEVPDGTGNDNLERVYSTLEENIPENGDRDVPERTGDDNPETVYSVLENENAV